MPYELIDHTADTGIRVWASDAKQLFSEACRAMFEQITDTDQLAPTRTRSISVEGFDLTDLLINWLRACLMIWTTQRCLVKSVKKLEICNMCVRASLSAEPFDPGRHVILTDIKAVTYHNADVSITKGTWQASVIFDI
jgi:SHS2 domain-containing protein